MKFMPSEKNNYIRYYLQPKLENKQSVVAKKMEFITILLILWVVTALYVLDIWGRSAPVLLVTFLILLGEYKLVNTLFKHRNKKRLKQYKIWLAGNKCLEDLEKIKNPSDFRDFVQGILTGVGGFSQIKRSKHKEKTHGIDLTAKYHNMPVAIRCEPVENPEQKLSVQYVHELIDDLEKLGLRNGIIATNGLIGRKAKAMADKFKKDYALTLLDRYQLVEYARKAGHKIFPASHVVEQLLIERQEQKSVDYLPLKNKLVGERSKAVRYFMSALILGIMYRLIGSLSFFGTVYLLFAAVNMVLGVMALIYGKSKYHFEDIQCIGSIKKAR